MLSCRPSVPSSKAAGAPVITYGVFINQIIEFFIIAACVFALVKIVNQIKRAPAPAPTEPPAPTRTEVLLEEIRDALKK
jgi:large conductance mechanosensitive channel